MSANPKLIHIHVKFASSDKEPFEEAKEPETTVEELLADVMTYFAAVTDGTTRYFLKSEGRELLAGETVGAVATGPAGHTHALRMGLRTETVSG